MNHKEINRFQDRDFVKSIATGGLLLTGSRIFALEVSKYMRFTFVELPETSSGQVVNSVHTNTKKLRKNTI